MQTLTVSFFGHRRIENALQIETRLEQLIRELLRKHEYIEFLVGRDGDFDRLVSSTIQRCKREYRSDNSAHIWVLPYSTAELRENEEAFRDYYDEIEICEESAGSHYKNAHQTRNQIMADRSELLVFCIQHERGGAWQTYQYARKKGIPCINLHTETMAGWEFGRY
ncbi:MAG: hypothetical protein IJA75_06715 [Oscillospiraceae bacterium]|nr:hypothetical protein [Oscillospiraceae bacterium]